MPMVSTSAKEVFELFHIALRTATDIDYAQCEPGAEHSKESRVSVIEARELFESIKASPSAASVTEWDHSPGEAAWMVSGRRADGGSLSLSILSRSTLAEARRLAGTNQADPWAGIPRSAAKVWEFMRPNLTEDEVEQAIRSFPEATQVVSSGFYEGMADYQIWTRPGLPIAEVQVVILDDPEQGTGLFINPRQHWNNPVSALVADYLVHRLTGGNADEWVRWPE